MPGVTIKSKREIELMRDAGKLLRDVHLRLGEEIAPGISTLDLDRLGEELIRKTDSIPSFLNYEGYPASVCVSINDEVVHGIPKANRIIQEGDIVSLDIGLIHNGFQSDAARTHAVGQVSEEASALIKVTEESFFEGMKYATAGNHLHDISNAIADYIEPFGYGIVGENYSKFDGYKEYAIWWTADLCEEAPDKAYYRYIYKDKGDLFLGNAGTDSFVANVRCVR